MSLHLKPEGTRLGRRAAWLANAAQLCPGLQGSRVLSTKTSRGPLKVMTCQEGMKWWCSGPRSQLQLGTTALSPWYQPMVAAGSMKQPNHCQSLQRLPTATHQQQRQPAQDHSCRPQDSAPRRDARLWAPLSQAQRQTHHTMRPASPQTAP